MYFANFGYFMMSLLRSLRREDGTYVRFVPAVRLAAGLSILEDDVPPPDVPSSCWPFLPVDRHSCLRLGRRRWFRRDDLADRGGRDAGASDRDAAAATHTDAGHRPA